MINRKNTIERRVLRTPIFLGVLTLDTTHLFTAEDSLWSKEKCEKQEN